MLSIFFFFFFNDTATTEIYTLSLHDALPILRGMGREAARVAHRGRVHPGELPEEPFCAPEAPHAEHGLAQADRERRHNAMPVHEMLLRYRERCAASGQGGLPCRHRRFLAERRHGVSLLREGDRKSVV